MPRRFYETRSKNLRLITSPIDVPGFDVIVTWHPRTDAEPAHAWLRELLCEMNEVVE
jgi:hypothetical protein